MLQLRHWKKNNYRNFNQGKMNVMNEGKKLVRVNKYPNVPQVHIMYAFGTMPIIPLWISFDDKTVA